MGIVYLAYSLVIAARKERSMPIDALIYPCLG